MINEQQLNKKVLKAQGGCKSSKWEVIAHFLPKILETVQKNWWKVVNEEDFEEALFEAVSHSIKNFEPSKGKFATLVSKNIYERYVEYTNLEKRPLLARRIYKTYTVDQLRTDGDMEYDIYDPHGVSLENEALADVFVREKIAFLAEGDKRNDIILRLWSDGYRSVSFIARVLADNLGGKEETHRKHIQRFKETCRKRLAAVHDIDS